MPAKASSSTRSPRRVPRNRESGAAQAEVPDAPPAGEPLGAANEENSKAKVNKTTPRKARGAKVKKDSRTEQAINNSQFEVNGTQQHPGAVEVEQIDAVEPPKSAIKTKRTAATTAKKVEVTGSAQISSGTKRKRITAKEEDTLSKGDSPEKAKRNTKGTEEGRIIKSEEVASPKAKRKTKTTIKQETEEAPEAQADEDAPEKTKRKTKVKVKEETAEGEEGDGEAETPKKIKRKRKTKEEKEPEAMPLAARTPGLKSFIGAHVSCAKGPFTQHAHRCWMYIASIKLKTCILI